MITFSAQILGDITIYHQLTAQWFPVYGFIDCWKTHPTWAHLRWQKELICRRFPTSIITNVMQRSFEVPVLLFDARVTMEIRITNVITMDAGQENKLSSLFFLLLLLLLSLSLFVFEYLDVLLKWPLAIWHMWPFACLFGIIHSHPFFNKANTPYDTVLLWSLPSRGTSFEISSLSYFRGIIELSQAWWDHGPNNPWDSGYILTKQDFNESSWWKL